MKVKFSPLVSQASGKAGPIVASHWKGINYLRELVIPANPDSTGTYGQQEHRARLKKIVTWWHDVEQQVQDYVKTLVTGLPLTAFNAFCKRNLYDISLGTIADRKAADDPRIIPLNTDELPVATFVLSTGSGAKELDLTWTAGEAEGTHKAYALVGDVSGDGVFPDNLDVAEADTTLISALTTTFAAVAGDTWYFVALLVEDHEAHAFSIALCDWAQSNAA